MEIQSYSMSGVTEDRAMDIISKIGSLVMVRSIGATKREVSTFFDVSERTLERVLEVNRNDFLMYGDYKMSKKKIRKLVSDKSVGTLLPRNMSKVNLFNRKHILLFVCHLGSSSDVGKKVIQYLIQVESNASKEDKVTSAMEALGKWDDLPSEVKSTVYVNALNSIREAKGLIAFAESVGESKNLVSMNDFAKSTYGTLGLGRNTLFSEMRLNGILNHQNRPYHCYIKTGYFEVVTRIINGKVIHQPMLTGKGEVWLLARMKRILGI